MACIKIEQAEGSQLPPELWADVLSFLSQADLGRALCTCRALARISQDAWRAACYRRWPAWAAIAEEPEAQWRRVYELLDLRESEQAAVIDLEALRKCQTVSFEWRLDSSVVFEAVKYLDWFQLVGLGCLRTAMREFLAPMPGSLTSEQFLDATRFAHISDDTYTPDEVVDLTNDVATIIPGDLNDYPNPKMHLRSFWFRATMRDVVNAQDMHIYTLASFLLQLSLLDLPCSAYPASQLAAAALSLSFTAFNKPAWPTVMESYGSYTLAELEPARHHLAAAQATHTASQLRGCWKRTYAPGNLDDYCEEWNQMVRIFEFSSRWLAQLLGKNSACEEPRVKYPPKEADAQRRVHLASTMSSPNPPQTLMPAGLPVVSVS